MTTAQAYSVRHLTVDSRDRDADLFPEPTRFDVPLEAEVKDVSAISLRSWRVPAVLPVAQGADALWLEDQAGAVREARAPYPYRSPADEAGFLAALSAAATAAAGQPVTVAAAAGGAVTLSSPSPFAVYSGDPSVAVWAPPPDPPSIDDKPHEVKNQQPPDSPRFTSRRLGDGYGAGSVARALGLPRGRTPAEPDGSGGFIVEAPHRSRLNEAETAYVRVEEARGFEATAAGVATGASGCLAVVSPHAPDGCVATAVLGDPGASLVTKAFHPPMSKLQRLSISVVDYFGRPLRTDNAEVRLDFRVETLPSNAGAERGFAINNSSRPYETAEARPPAPTPLSMPMAMPMAMPRPVQQAPLHPAMSAPPPRPHAEFVSQPSTPLRALRLHEAAGFRYGTARR